MNDAAEFRVHADASALAAAAARRWQAIAAEAVAARGRFDVALAGGATPQTLYRLLAHPEWRASIDWGATHFWFGDERCVAPDHPDSNYRMAREALFDAIDTPPAQIHRIEGERAPEEAARRYEDTLRMQFAPAADDPPRLDLVLLGLGTDGHIASLFPDTPLLDESRRWVGANRVAKLDAWRISLTLPLLNAARHVVLLVSGEAKAAIVGEVLGQARTALPRYPVDRLRPAGRLEWLLDAAAAARLDPRGTLQ